MRYAVNDYWEKKNTNNSTRQWNILFKDGFVLEVIVLMGYGAPAVQRITLKDNAVTVVEEYLFAGREYQAVIQPATPTVPQRWHAAALFFNAKRLEEYIVPWDVFFSMGRIQVWQLVRSAFTDDDEKLEEMYVKMVIRTSPQEASIVYSTGEMLTFYKTDNAPGPTKVLLSSVTKKVLIELNRDSGNMYSTIWNDPTVTLYYLEQLLVIAGRYLENQKTAYDLIWSMVMHHGEKITKQLKISLPKNRLHSIPFGNRHIPIVILPGDPTSSTCTVYLKNGLKVCFEEDNITFGRGTFRETYFELEFCRSSQTDKLGWRVTKSSSHYNQRYFYQVWMAVLASVRKLYPSYGTDYALEKIAKNAPYLLDHLYKGVVPNG